MSASWWILNHEQKSPLSSEPCNDTNCHSYSPLLYFYSEIWASEREHWNMKQKWDWHSGKQRTEHGVHCKKQRPWTGVEKVSAHFHWSGKGQMWFLTVVAFTPPPSTSTFPLLQRYCLHSVICLDSLCKWLPRSCNPNVHFVSWISHQLSWMSTLFLTSYFKHLSTLYVISYTNEQGFPWIGF